MTIQNNHKIIGISLGLMSVILAGSIAAQLKLWQQQQRLEMQHNQSLKQEENKFAHLNAQFQTQTQDIQHVQQSLQAIAKPKTQIEDLQWLIQEADWQINLFHQLNLSQHLLKLALNLAQNQNWQGLSQALEADLKQLSLISLTPSHEIVEVCSKLQNQLGLLSAKIPSQQAQIQDAPLPKYIEVFKPYFQIERYSKVTPKVIPPSRQNQIIDQLNLLLPSIQAAALSHQQPLYHQLLAQFQQLWQSLQASQKDANIDALVLQLQNFQVSLAGPIHLQAADAAQNLEHQLFSQAPV